MTKVEARNREIVIKSKTGILPEKLATEYKISLSNVNSIIEKYHEFKDYCTQMEDLKAKNQANEETQIYDLVKLLEFDNRSINALLRKNIRSIDQLILLTEEEIYTLRSVGKITRTHIKKCISNYRENSTNSLKEYDNEDIILENYNTNVNLYMLKIMVESESEYDSCIGNCPYCKCSSLENTKVNGECSVTESDPVYEVCLENTKVNREYIWKLIKLVDEGQFASSFLKKELEKEFNKIEKTNEQLVEMLLDLKKDKD